MNYIAAQVFLMQLLKSQLNSFYDVLNGHGFNLDQFRVETGVISETFSVDGSLLQYVPENYSFNCGEDSGVFYCVYSPSSNKLIENIRSVNWTDIQSAFMRWVISLQNEINQVDKWAALRDAINNVSIQVTTSTEKFNYQEFKEVENRMILLKDRIKSIPLTTEQFTLLDQKLEYLIEAAKDSKKIDWGNIFVGAIVGLVLNLAITQENANLLWEAIKHAFNNYIFLN